MLDKHGNFMDEPMDNYEAENIGNQQEMEKELEEHNEDYFLPLEPMYIVGRVNKKQGQEVTDSLLVEVTVESGKGNMLCYLNLKPIEHPKNKITTEYIHDFLASTKFPISVQFGVLITAIGESGCKIPVIDNRQEWFCRFSDRAYVSQFTFSNFSHHETYELIFYKKSVGFFRLIGKLINMIAGIESWNVSLPSIPNIMVSKKLGNNLKPVVEIILPQTSLMLNREEMFGIINWFDNYVATKSMINNLQTGVYFPDIDKSKKIFFGFEDKHAKEIVQSEESKTTNLKNIKNNTLGLKIGRYDFPNQHITRLLIGTIKMATYSA